MSTPSQRFAQKMEQTGMAKSPMLRMATKGVPDPKKAKLKKGKPSKKGKAGKMGKAKPAKTEAAPKYDFKAGLSAK